MPRPALLLVLLASVALHACAAGDPAAEDTAAVAPADTTASGRDMISILEAEGGFETFVAGIDSVGLGGELRGSGPFTLLAPTDSAFAALPDEDRRALLGDSARLARVLHYHVIPGRLTAADLQGMTSVTTLEGTTVPVRFEGGTLRIGEAAVIRADLDTENGTVHVLDGVLVPGN